MSSLYRSVIVDGAGSRRRILVEFLPSEGDRIWLDGTQYVVHMIVWTPDPIYGTDAYEPVLTVRSSEGVYR